MELGEHIFAHEALIEISFRAWMLRIPTDASLTTNNDVVDRNEDQLHGVANKSHDGKTNGTRDGNFLKLLGIWFCATLDEAARVVAKFICTLNYVTDRIALVLQKGHR